jgi:hypothetical protein
MSEPERPVFDGETRLIAMRRIRDIATGRWATPITLGVPLKISGYGWQVEH